jgi:hypothetical protein
MAIPTRDPMGMLTYPANGTTFKMSADSVLLGTTNTESSVLCFALTGAAKDTVEAGAVAKSGMKIWPTALQVNVMGASSSNRTDTRYGIQVMGRKKSSHSLLD